MLIEEDRVHVCAGGWTPRIHGAGRAPGPADFHVHTWMDHVGQPRAYRLRSGGRRGETSSRLTRPPDYSRSIFFLRRLFPIRSPNTSAFSLKHATELPRKTIRWCMQGFRGQHFRASQRADPFRLRVPVRIEMNTKVGLTLRFQRTRVRFLSTA